MNTTNPLLQQWNTPYGMPPFDLIETGHFAPALDHAMEAHKAEIAAIASSKETPSFANTIEAFEKSGAECNRVMSVFFNLTSSLSSEALQAVELEYSPKITGHYASVFLDAALFARIDSIYAKRLAIGLEPVQIRLVERLRLDFVLAGALLDPAGKARMAKLMESLSERTTTFGQHVLADEDGTVIFLESEADLAGLPDDLITAAAEVAKGKGREGIWAITLSRSFVEPFLTHSTRRDLRKKVYDAFSSRGEMTSERDTKPIIRDILKLRAEQARLHGYKSFADYALVDRMAGAPAAVAGLLDQVWPAAKKRAEEEGQSLLAFARKADGLERLEAWDWRFYAEQVRKRDYQLDDSQVKPYFVLDNMVEAMFWAAGKLFGIEFKEVKGIPLYHPDARIFEVRNRSDGSIRGIFINDNFARGGKRSGAWMSSYRNQSAGVVPIISNNNNFTRGKPGEPVLLSFDDVSTLFHEFGHGLHGLLSMVPYQAISGTNVLRDFVELPSQLFEHWVLAPEVLAKFARHVTTNEPIPAALVEKIRATRTFNMGWDTLQYLGPALLDMSLHAIGDPEDFDAARYEESECAKLGLPREVGLRHRLPHFQHLFSSEAYAAGYYVYMWAEVLEADAFAAFEEKGNLFDPELATRLEKNIYGSGNSLDPSQAFRNFRGREPRIEALLKQRGLA